VPFDDRSQLRSGKKEVVMFHEIKTGSHSRIAGGDWPVNAVRELVETGHRFRGVGRKLVAAGLQAPIQQFGLS